MKEGGLSTWEPHRCESDCRRKVEKKVKIPEGVVEFQERVTILRSKGKMVRRMRMYLVLLLSVLLSACAPFISEKIREEIDTSVTFKEAAQNPNNYVGKIVLWGGEIIETLPQKDGSTLIEVLEWPLGWTERPRRTVSFQGEFLVLLKGPVSPSFYRRGEKITVVGEILGSTQGEEIKFISDPTYRYPLLLSKEIHLWKWNLYPYSSVPDDRGSWEYREYGGILHY